MIPSIQSNPTIELASFLLTRDSTEISEYELFRLAYTAWYGQIPAAHYLEQQFDCYLQSGELPFYVRHYCRNYIEAHPETVKRAQQEDKRSRSTQRLVMVFIIGFVAGALILS